MKMYKIKKIEFTLFENFALEKPSDAGVRYGGAFGSSAAAAEQRSSSVRACAPARHPHGRRRGRRARHPSNPPLRERSKHTRRLSRNPCRVREEGLRCGKDAPVVARAASSPCTMFGLAPRMILPEVVRWNELSGTGIT